MTNEESVPLHGKAVYDADLYGDADARNGYSASIPVGEEDDQDERERLVARQAHPGCGTGNREVSSPGGGAAAVRGAWGGGAGPRCVRPSRRRRDCAAHADALHALAAQ